MLLLLALVSNFRQWDRSRTSDVNVGWKRVVVWTFDSVLRHEGRQVQLPLAASRALAIRWCSGRLACQLDRC